MKTIKKIDEIIRVTDNEAGDKIKSGFAYIKKSEWKQKVRDKGKVKIEKKVEKAEEVKDKPKGEGYAKYKANKERKSK